MTMNVLLRRILLAAVAAGAATALPAAPAIAAAATPAAPSVVVADQPGDDDADDADYDADDDADDDRGRAPLGGVQTGSGGHLNQPGDDDDDDDDGGAPAGGVDAGAGGTAAGPDLAVPLGAAAGVAALTGGAVLVRRLAGRAG